MSTPANRSWAALGMARQSLDHVETTIHGFHLILLSEYKFLVRKQGMQTQRLHFAVLAKGHCWVRIHCAQHSWVQQAIWSGIVEGNTISRDCAIGITHCLLNLSKLKQDLLRTWASSFPALKHSQIKNVFVANVGRQAKEEGECGCLLSGELLPRHLIRIQVRPVPCRNMFELFEIVWATSTRYGVIQHIPDIAILTFCDITSCCILLSTMFRFAMVPLAKEKQVQGKWNGYTSSTAQDGGRSFRLGNL